MKSLHLKTYITLFFLLISGIVFLGLIFQYNMLKQSSSENFINEHYSKALHKRESFRLIFDKLQFNFRQAEAQGIKKFEDYFSYYKSQKENFDIDVLAKQLNKNVKFGHYEAFLINEKNIIENASFKPDLFYDLGQFKSVRDLFGKLRKKEISIDISAPIWDYTSFALKRYFIKLSPNGKDIFQIAFVLDLRTFLNHSSLKDIENKLFLSSRYTMQAINFTSLDKGKTTFKEGWENAKELFINLHKFTNDEQLKYLIGANMNQEKIKIDLLMDKLFKDSENLLYFFDKDKKNIYFYSITNGLFNKSKETKVIVQSKYSTSKLLLQESKNFNILTSTLIISLILLFFVYLFILAKVSKPIVNIVNDIQNNIISQQKLTKVYEIDILQSQYNKLHERLNTQLINNELLLKENKQFIADMVHQIRTPLTVIMTNSSIIETKGYEELNVFLNQINSAILMLSNSYEDLSYIISYDAIEYKPSNFNISEMLEDRVEFFSFIIESNYKQISFDIQKNIFFFINSIEFERLVDNNISNALKHSNENSLIHVSLKEKKNSIVLDFISQGKKIENKDKIFEKNYSENESKRSLGLGLYMVKNICEKYNVKYEVKSSNKKNCFRYIFTLK